MYVEGDGGQVRAILDYAASPDIRACTYAGDVYVESSAFADCVSHGEVAAKASVLFDLIRILARQQGRAVPDITPGAILLHEDEETTAVVTTTRAIAVWGTDGSPANDPPLGQDEIVLLLANCQDKRVRLVLTNYAKADDWHHLSNVLDSIEEAVGGERALKQRGWAAAGDIDRFTGTVNNAKTLGPGARHGRLGWDPPATTMNLPEAQDLIGLLLRRWIQAKSEE